MKKNIGELIKQAKSGNKQAFTELIKNIEGYLYKVAKMRLYSEDDIEDAVQDTIIQAYTSIKKLKNLAYFNTWIIKILINKCNKIYKKTQKEKIHNLNIDEICEKTYASEQENINNIDFFILIEKLKYKERISLILYYLLQFTTKEIAYVLKEPESTIRNRIARAKKKLQKILEEEK